MEWRHRPDFCAVDEGGEWGKEPLSDLDTWKAKRWSLDLVKPPLWHMDREGGFNLGFDDKFGPGCGVLVIIMHSRAQQLN